MASDCPICEQRVGDADRSCPGCGFPVALHPEAVRVLAEGDPPAAVLVVPNRSAAGTRRSPAQGSRGRDQTAEACTRAAKDLRGQLSILHQLGGETVPLLGEMRQAALVQAEGKVTDALELLRGAERRAGQQVGELNLAVELVREVRDDA